MKSDSSSKAEYKKRMVHLKGGFSERKGITDFSKKIQINSLDTRTRNYIVNFLGDFIPEMLRVDKTESYKGDRVQGYKGFIKYLYTDIFSKTLGDIPIKFGVYDEPWIVYQQVERDIYVVVETGSYDEVFDLLIAINQYLLRLYNISNPFKMRINSIFEREGVMYRFVGETITDITNESEINEINEALSYNDDSCTQHLLKAIGYLYNREKPDYENSVKESISAVEALCNIITGSKDSLGKALYRLTTLGIKIHPCMENAFEKLYGYTSDEAGIRHASGLDLRTTFAEAKFMLVCCSAFVNYLRDISVKCSEGKA